MRCGQDGKRHTSHLPTFYCLDFNFMTILDCKACWACSLVLCLKEEHRLSDQLAISATGEDVSIRRQLNFRKRQQQ